MSRSLLRILKIKNYLLQLSQAHLVGQCHKSSPGVSEAEFSESNVEVGVLYKRDVLICITFRSMFLLIQYS